MTLLDSVQKDYATIDQAAGEFLHKLSGNNLQRDIVLAAEMAGLQLLRAAAVDLSKFNPGSIILGAISDQTYEQLQRFVFGWALSNGLNPEDAGDFEIPDDITNYIPEITQLESSFNSICEQNSITKEHYPFVAASSALKLVLAGENLKLLDAKLGLAITMYHLIAGGKTVPNHPNSE